MKIKTKTLFENIVAICIILDCESVWKWMHGSGYFRLALTLCLIGSLMALLLRDGAVVRYGSKNRAIFMGFYLSFLVIYNVVVNSTHIMDVFQLAITITLMLLFFNNEENIRGSRFLLCKPCKMMEARKPGLRARLSCCHDAGKKTVLIVRGYHDKRTSETRRDLAALQEPSL